MSLTHLSVQDGELKDDFSKGMVFYTKEGVVVGVLTWNIFGKMDMARKVRAQHTRHGTRTHSLTLSHPVRVSFHSCR